LVSPPAADGKQDFRAVCCIQLLTEKFAEKEFLPHASPVVHGNQSYRIYVHDKL